MRRVIALAFFTCACAESVDAFHERCGYDEWIGHPRAGAARRIVRATVPLGGAVPEHGFHVPTIAQGWDDAPRAALKSPPPAPERLDDGVAVCEVAPAHPETLDPYDVNLVLGHVRGRGRPDIVVKGKLGQKRIEWGPQTRDVACFVEHDVTLAPNDVIDLDVGDADLGGVEHVGHVTGRFRARAPIELQTAAVRVSCALFAKTEWESRRMQALAALEADARRTKTITPSEDFSEAFAKAFEAHLLEYATYGHPLDEDVQRIARDAQATADAWWRAHVAELPISRTDLPAPGVWVSVDRDFDARVPGLACDGGDKHGIIPHCDIVVEVRPRRSGASLCGIVGDKIQSMTMSAVLDDGQVIHAMHSAQWRNGRPIATLHDLDALGPNDVVQLDLYVSGAEGWNIMRDEVDVMTASAIPWRVRAVRIGKTDLRVR